MGCETVALVAEFTSKQELRGPSWRGSSVRNHAPLTDLLAPQKGATAPNPARSA
jgi:hypothetical protein